MVMRPPRHSDVSPVVCVQPDRCERADTTTQLLRLSVQTEPCLSAAHDVPSRV